MINRYAGITALMENVYFNDKNLRLLCRINNNLRGGTAREVAPNRSIPAGIFVQLPRLSGDDAGRGVY
jgi:hypothetical protein